MEPSPPANPTPGASRPARGRPPLDGLARQRILDATAAVFLEKGFARASTNEIARRAKASKQTLYSLFPTKADLFVGVIGAHTSRLFARHPEFIQGSDPPAKTLNEMGFMMLSTFSAPTFLALYRIVVAEAHNFPLLARQLWCDVVERGYILLAEYLESRRLGGPLYRKSAEQFVSFGRLYRQRHAQPLFGVERLFLPVASSGCSAGFSPVASRECAERVRKQG